MEDLYLNWVVKNAYETGEWDEETTLKNVWAYARQNGIDVKMTNDFLASLIPIKSYTIEDKKSILSKIKFSDGGFKYPNGVLNNQSDYIIEKLFEVEEKILGKEEIKRLYDSKKDSKVEISDEHSDEHKEKTPIVEPKVGSDEDVKNALPDTFGVSSVRQEVLSQFSDDEETNDMPKSENEFEALNNNMCSFEEDSTVRHVEASQERIEKLKKGAKRVKRFFIKGAMVVITAYFMLGAPLASGVMLVGGYKVLSKKIKEGTFNPKGEFGNILKETVEKIMNIGKNKEERDRVR